MYFTKNPNPELFPCGSVANFLNYRPIQHFQTLNLNVLNVCKEQEINWISSLQSGDERGESITTDLT